MKLAIRIAALAVVVTGGVAAYCTPKSASALPSHQSATAGEPTPGCDDNGWCPGDPTTQGPSR
jgi:hypothetical protein